MVVACLPVARSSAMISRMKSSLGEVSDSDMEKKVNSDPWTVIGGRGTRSFREFLKQGLVQADAGFEVLDGEVFVRRVDLGVGKGET